MTYIGYLSAIIIFVCVWAMFATGRKSWLAPVVWAALMFAMSIGAKRGLAVNGLCLCIAFFETFLSIRALYGVIIWNQSFREKGVILPTVIYLITAVLVGYCLVQSQKTGYIPNVMNIGGENRALRNIINVVIVLAISFPAAYIGILRFEKFFSNETELTLLDCKFYTSALLGGTAFKGYYMYGINNGVKYYFRITKRTYFMLRLEDRLVLKMRKDLRGNLFAVKNPCPKNLENVARRDIRMAKNIAASAVVYAVLMVIIL